MPKADKQTTFLAACDCLFLLSKQPLDKTDFWWWKAKKWTSLNWILPCPSEFVSIGNNCVGSPPYLGPHTPPALSRLGSDQLTPPQSNDQAQENGLFYYPIFLWFILFSFNIARLLKDKKFGINFSVLDVLWGSVCRAWRLVHGWTGIFRLGRFCNISCEIYCNKVVVISDRFFA